MDGGVSIAGSASSEYGIPQVDVKWKCISEGKVPPDHYTGKQQGSGQEVHHIPGGLEVSQAGPLHASESGSA